MDKPLKSSPQVWEFIISEGGLDIESYDKSLETDIRQFLGLPIQGDLAKLLKKHEVSVENLLTAFFLSIQPFSLMMSDLLKMFEVAGADRSNHNISIQFDFGKGIEDLSFDLNHFRKWIEEWRTVRRTVSLELWNSNLLWQLVPGRFRNNMEPEDDIARRWLEEYRHGNLWPKIQIGTPKTGNADFDDVVKRLWGVWAIVLAKCMSISSGPENLRQIAGIETNDITIFENSGELKDWKVRDLWYLESDHWLGAFLKGVYLLVEEINGASNTERTKLISGTLTAWKEILSNVGENTAEYDDIERELKAFLELPIWKKRYELYSAWVCTTIVGAFPKDDIKIHHYKSELLFNFAGSHIATIGNNAPFKQLWAELRTPFANPIGRSRKKAIQPDYSLCADPSTHPGATIMAIECKQYLKASPKKFSEALIDYARGRPNAKIVLVNYGEIKRNLGELLPEDVKNRCFIVAPLRPDYPALINELKILIQNSNTPAPGTFRVKKHSHTGGQLDIPGKITLQWGKDPSDLDLHILIESSHTECIYYRNKGSIDSLPWCEYDEDIQKGYGPESIKIERWLSGKYTCYVHNYSDDSLLTKSEASIEFFCGDYSHQFNCPVEGIGRLWKVFEIEIIGEIASLLIINEIEDRSLDLKRSRS